jgi:hypothetical protein
MKMERLTDYHKGDRIKLIRDVRDFAHGFQVFASGEVGTLIFIYRVQDGKEVWSLKLDRMAIGIRIAVCHTDFERI